MFLDRIRQSGWAQFIIIHVVAVAAPVMLVVGAGPYSADVRSVLQMAVSLAFVFTSALILLEAAMSVRRRQGPGLHGTRQGRARDLTVILVAYLPNEQDVIIDSAMAVLRDLKHPHDRLQLLVAYNTPEDLPVEAELHELARTNESIEILRVEGSTSKAENLLAAIGHARGSVTAILDSDHRMHPEAAKRALRWFDEGYDIVQGRCVIRNGGDSLLARLVAIEFEQIYGLAHAGRSLLMDTAIFGGANGWWRTGVLRQLGFDKSMLTEDIDISMRAMMGGFKIIHDRSVMSNELAPTSWKNWWKQRTRWAQGWLQVTMRHQKPLMASPILSWPLKLYWSVLLTWRELFPIIAIQIVTLVVSDLITTGSIQIKADPLAGLSLFLTLSSGGLTAWATWRLSTPETRASQGPWRYAFFGMTAGLYTMVKNTVALVALAREALGDHRWVVTARTNAPAAGAAAGSAALLAVALTGAALLGSGTLAPSSAAAATSNVTAAATDAIAAGTTPSTVRAPEIGPTFAVDNAIDDVPAPSAVVAPQRTIPIVGEDDQPVTLNPTITRAVYNLAVPGFWSSVSGTMILKLDGAAELSDASRLQVTINGRQVAAGRADPQEKSIAIPIPNLAVPDHNLQVVIDTQLRTTLSPCPPLGDPTATLQVLPGTLVKLTPVLERDMTLGDLPGALSNALGNAPTEVTVRFAHPNPSSEALVAAGTAAGAIAVSRGYPGANVQIVDGKKRPTILIDDRPGLGRMRLSVRDGRPTLIIAGHGKALIRGALELTNDQLKNVKDRILENPDGTVAGRDLLPDLVTLGGDTESTPGTSIASSSFTIPGRYQIHRGARLRFTGSIESPGTTRASITINGRRLSSKVDSSTGMPLRIDTLLAGRGPSYLLGDLRPGDNEIQVKALAIGSPKYCATQTAITTTIDPAGTLRIQAEKRPLSNTSLADWPYPLDAGPNWTGAQVVIPKGATDHEYANVIAALAEAQRVTGEPALPEITTTMPTNPTVPTLILARPGSVPPSLSTGIEGGVDAGTLAFRTSAAGAGVVIAVGSRSLIPLMTSYSPNDLNAVTVDVNQDGQQTLRTPYTPVVTATKPLPGNVKWPLIVLALSIAWLFIMSLRATHRRAKQMLEASPTTPPAGAGA